MARSPATVMYTDRRLSKMKYGPSTKGTNTLTMITWLHITIKQHVFYGLVWSPNGKCDSFLPPT